MAIVKYKNQSGITYAYESISEWDPVRKQSRPKRRYLGRVDEETGEIIPTEGRRGRPRKNPMPAESSASEATIAASSDGLSPEKTALPGQDQEALERLIEENARLSEENRKLRETIASIYQQAASVMEQVQR